MRGNVEFTGGKCPHCNEQRKFERPSAIWGVGDLFMVLMTGGLWLVGKLMLRPKYRCCVCGTVKP